MITIAGQNFESHKTTLPVEDREVVLECDITDSVALTGVEKAIKVKTFSYSSSLNMISGLHEITDIFSDPFLGKKAAGIDYIMRFNYLYSASPSQASLLYSYNATSTQQFFKEVALGASGTIDWHISDLNCTGGDYANDIEQFILSFKNSSLFFLDLTITLIEQVPTTFSYLTCDNFTIEVEEASNTETDPLYDYVFFAPEDEEPGLNAIRRRGLIQDAPNFGACASFQSDYKATIYSQAISSPTDHYLLESGFDHIKVKVTGASAFTNTIHVEIENLGLSQSQLIIIPVTGIPTTLTSTLDPLTLTPDTYTVTLYEVILGTPTPISIDTFVEIDLYGLSVADDCPCPCSDGCIDESIVIAWRNNCGELVSTRFEGQIKGGSYTIAGDGFKTYDGEEIFPEVSTKNEYQLVITQYSDEVFKALAYLIANNLDITINGVKYLIQPFVMNPTWDVFSRFGSITINIIEKDSISTIKRNCCG